MSCSGLVFHGWTGTQPTVTRGAGEQLGSPGKVPWVDPGPQPHTKNVVTMGGQTLAGTQPPSIKGQRMGGPDSDLFPHFHGAYGSSREICQFEAQPKLKIYT